MTSIPASEAPFAPAPSGTGLLGEYDIESSFYFSSKVRTILGRGVGEIIARPGRSAPAEAFAERVATVLAGLERAGHDRPMAVGALPFAANSPAHLFVPTAIRSAGPVDAASISPRPSSPVSVDGMRMSPERDVYLRGVERALDAIRDDELSKVVLSRMLELRLSQPVELHPLLERLSKRNASGYTFAVRLPEGRGSGATYPRTLIGASPELLVSRSGKAVFANPLAGSAPRSPDPEEDQRRANALLASEKDRREHAVVIEAIADALQPFCRSLSVPSSPSLVHTEAMWHLATPITGELADLSTSSLRLAMALHPTPAVCGYPTARARAAIEAIEPFDRGLFTGLVGYCDASGDGEWAVTIRCADISSDTIRVYAGAGLVAGSAPERERAEISAKMRTVLTALGLGSLPEDL
ncbi:isochorismate synthase DhbC [Polyangium mundeleinium]|uniref:isochorismate synthase n=1 Tax=Polyangium mundeleinium TaxID=2995306 RepID=A0ABT5EFM5_9BACT|nr:isochorismate synthase DhbC [Polyangium mundeleinium]MDC0740610.1 isochorismate synthase DhbC [Polyangium mundeleinium]